MIRLAAPVVASFAVASLAVAMPAGAQTHVLASHSDAHGATAGRSPHRIYRPIAATSCGAAQAATLPGGRLPVLGAPRAADCATTIARADAPATAAVD